MIRQILLTILTISSLAAFESTNVQLLYSNNFKGDAFIYDTKDGVKTTLTFEHFRTFSYGDLYMFVDLMDGEKFDSSKHEVYTEIAPRFSLSKLSKKDLSLSFIRDFYIATQINEGYDYRAYLGGLGMDLNIPGFNFFSLNIYYKSDNINKDDTYQITPAYQTRSLYKLHFEGFLDLTRRDVNTQNQLLYNVNSNFFIGSEWIYYHYNDGGITATTNVLQAMVKYQF